MSILIRIYLALGLFACLLLPVSGYAAMPQDMRIIVLPFEVNAGEDLAYLHESLPDLLTERLASKGFAVVPRAQVMELIQQQGVTELSIATVRDLSVLAGASYAIYGSFNQVGNNISIDARIVEAYGLQPAKPVYIAKQGLINILPAVNELADAASNEMLSKNTLSKVSVRGTKVLDPDVVLMRLRLRKGDLLDGKSVNEEIKRIYELGYFSDVVASVEQGRDGMELVFTVTEKPRVEKIVVEGSDAVDEDDILAAMSIKTGAVMNEKLLSQDLEKVKELYRKDGYYLAQVEHRVEEHEGHSSTLVLTITEGNKLYIREVRLLGVESLDPDDVKDELALSPRNMLSWYTGSGVLREDYLERDAAAIGAYYLNRGFMDVRVANPQVDYEEDGIIITFRVKEGTRYKVGNITFRGDLIEPDERLRDLISLDEWKKDEKFLNYSIIKDDTNSLTEFYAKHGYAFAEVDFETNKAGDDVIDLVYSVAKRNKVYVRNVTIEGNSHTRDNVIRREIKLTDGEQFDGEKLRKSNAALNSLGFFSSSEVEMVPTDTANEVDLKVKVKEQNTGSLMAGVGWNTWGGMGVSGSIRESNLWGKGYMASLGGTFASDYNRYDFVFQNPRLFDSIYSLSLNSYLSDYEYDDYSVDTLGTSVTIGRPISERTTIYGGYRLDSYRIFDVEDSASSLIRKQEGRHLASVVSTSIARSTIDDRQRPTAGTYIRLWGEYGGGMLQGDDEFVKFMAEMRGYYALNKNNVLMGRVRGATLLENGSGDEVPLVERFWIGGITTVRGYEREDFAIRDYDDEKIGGTRMAFANLEYQWYFNNEMGMALVPFIDTGINRDNSRDSSGQNGLLTSAGLEWRWKSPMGDLRFAYGVPLTDVDGSRPDPRFEFSMGQSF